MIKIFLFLVLIYNSSFAVDFFIIEVTDNQALNYFFTFPIYTMLISLPFIALINLLKKI